MLMEETRAPCLSFCLWTVQCPCHSPFPFQSSVLTWLGIPHDRESQSFVDHSLRTRERKIHLLSQLEIGNRLHERQGSMGW